MHGRIKFLRFMKNCQCVHCVTSKWNVSNNYWELISIL